jgi:hypothetical protein
LRSLPILALFFSVWITNALGKGMSGHFSSHCPGILVLGSVPKGIQPETPLYRHELDPMHWAPACDICLKLSGLWRSVVFFSPVLSWEKNLSSLPGLPSHCRTASLNYSFVHLCCADGPWTGFPRMYPEHIGSEAISSWASAV